MDPKKISIMSTLTDIILAAAKLVFGILNHSVVLFAESLHSLLDAASSFIAYLGIKAVEKPADKTHPYGYERYDGFGSLVIVFMLLIIGCWITSDAVKSIISGHSEAVFDLKNIYLMSAAILINIILKYTKHKVSIKFPSLSLSADSRHSRANIISSFAVLLGLIAIKYYPIIDSILALTVAIFIFWETYNLGQQSFDALLDKSNPSLEAKIKRRLRSKDEHFKDLKTRKMGQANIAEVSLLVDPESRVGDVSKKIEMIEEELVESIDELKDVSVTIKSLEIEEKSK